MLIKSKIVLAVLAGGTVTLGGLGLLFNGTQTLQDASSYVKDAGDRLVQYELNENSLLEKIGLIKTDASNKLSDANANIEELEAQKATLEGSVKELSAIVEGLESDIKDLESKLANTQGDLESAQQSLAKKTAEYEAKKKELSLAKAEIQALKATIAYGAEKAVKADKLVAELEAEIKKANNEVANHGKVVTETEEATEDAQPLSQDELNAIEVEVGSEQPVEAK